jgi:hypothetical protein
MMFFSILLDLAPTAGTMRAADSDTRRPPAGNCATDLFAETLIDDSNHELDWLWAASQLTDIFQRRYCLERALMINANSELARRELDQLAPKPIAEKGNLR